jgi:chromosome segregation ATPase
MELHQREIQRLETAIQGRIDGIRECHQQLGRILADDSGRKKLPETFAPHLERVETLGRRISEIEVRVEELMELVTRVDCIDEDIDALNTEIRGLQNDVAEHLPTIGEMAYLIYKNSDLREKPEFQSLFAATVACENELEEAQRELAELKQSVESGFFNRIKASALRPWYRRDVKKREKDKRDTYPELAQAIRSSSFADEIDNENFRALLDQIDAKEDEIAQIREQVSSLKQDKEELTAKVDAEAEGTTVQKLLKSWDQQIADLESAVAREHLAIGELADESVDNIPAAKEIKAVLGEIETFRAENEKDKELIKARQAAIELDEKQTQIEDLGRQHDRIVEDIERLHGQIQSRTQELENLEATVEEQKDTAADLENYIRSIDPTVLEPSEEEASTS